MPFARTRRVLNAVPAPFAIATPGLPTQAELQQIRAAAETHRDRVFAALLKDLATLPTDLFRGGAGRTDLQAV